MSGYWLLYTYDLHRTHIHKENSDSIGCVAATQHEMNTVSIHLHTYQQFSCVYSRCWYNSVLRKIFNYVYINTMYVFVYMACRAFLLQWPYIYIPEST